MSHSPRMHLLRELIRRLETVEAPVHILGEPGTEKTLIAAALHETGPRPEGPLLTLCCSGPSSDRLDLELFGYEARAFPNAKRPRPGLLELAKGGTLYLEDIDALSLALQRKLVLTVRLGDMHRRGGGEAIDVSDLRFISSSSIDLTVLCAAGRYRQDLFYRLNVVEINLPPLRERLEDLPYLVEALLATEDEPWTLGPGALERLEAHPWPGNLRELGAVLEAAQRSSSGREILPEALVFGRWS